MSEILEKLLRDCQANVLHFRLQIRDAVQLCDRATVYRAEDEIKYWSAWASRYQEALDHESKSAQQNH